MLRILFLAIALWFIPANTNAKELNFHFENIEKSDKTQNNLKKLTDNCPNLFKEYSTFIDSVVVSNYEYPLYFFDEGYTGKGGFDSSEKSWNTSTNVIVKLKNGNKTFEFWINDQGSVTNKSETRKFCGWKNREGFNLFHKYSNNKKAGN